MTPRLQCARGLVESDVRVRPDAEEQEVQASERGDLAFESLALVRMIARAAVQEMDVTGGRLMRVNRCFCMKAQ